MKKLSFLGVTFFCMSCFAQDVINDKNAQVRPVVNFNAIKVSGGIEVYLSEGSTEALAVSASESKVRDKIRTEVVDGTLRIWYDAGMLLWNTGNKKMRAYVSYKMLTRLEATGASGFRISGTLKVPTLELRLSGASNIKGNVKISNLYVEIRGASDVKVDGIVGTLKIEASGASDVKSYDLVADDCTASVSGASDVRVTINRELNVTASGASSVYYKGNAVVKSIHTSGASSVSRRS